MTENPVTAPEACWRPIEQYVHRENGWRTVHVLLGWFRAPMGGYPAGMQSFGVGWWQHGLWVDASDHKPWPRQPSHFACVASDLPMAPGVHKDWEFPDWTVTINATKQSPTLDEVRAGMDAEREVLKS